MNPSLSAYHFSKEQIRQEEDLIRQSQQDPSKFGLLYKKYHEQIFMFVLKRVETEDTAADITSQVFLKVLMSLGKYKAMGLPFASWLYRIARNEVYNLHQKNKITLVLSIESQGMWDMVSEIKEEKEKDKEESYKKLQASLNLLPNHELELIEMRYFEKRPFNEIAEILDVTENNAKVKTYRILEKLKKLISNER